MYFKSHKLPLLLLGIASIVCSRICFLFINDPEGPNLLVVFGLAVIIFFVALGILRFSNIITFHVR